MENFQQVLKFHFVGQGPSRNLDCNKMWVICLFTGNIGSEKFVGSSTEGVRYRWNNYTNSDEKYVQGQSYNQQHIFEHFKSERYSSLVIFQPYRYKS